MRNCHWDRRFSLAKGKTPNIEHFPTTQWSNVIRAGHAQTQVKREALNDLLTRYLPAVRSHLIFRKRVHPDQVDDLIQGFVASRVIEKDLIARVERERGKFRTFLLTALDRYIIGQYRHNSAKKRSAGQMANLADLPDLAGDREDTSCMFDVQWARTLLSDALDRMQKQCHGSGRDDLWNIFECRLLGPILNQQPAPSYEQLIEKFQLVSPTQASNLLVSAKRMFTRLLRSVVAEYTPDPEQIDQEITDLMKILATAGPQPDYQPQTLGST